MGKKYMDLTGMVFERLTVINRDYTRKGRAFWWCSCSCNNKLLKISVPTGSLMNGNTKSCGCLQLERILQYNLNVVTKHNKYNITGEFGIGYTPKGEEFYFDLEDYDKIKPYYWDKNAYGYIVYHRESGDIHMHRLVMNITDKNLESDHIYHINYDNRKEHLRVVTSSQNNMNRALFKNNTSGVTGVGWSKRENRWLVIIQVRKKSHYIGRYLEFDDAVKARKDAEEKYFGEYSYDNSMKLSEIVIQDNSI